MFHQYQHGQNNPFVNELIKFLDSKKSSYTCTCYMYAYTCNWSATCTVYTLKVKNNTVYYSHTTAVE